MDEAEWLTSTNPYAMFRHLGTRLTARKLRLLHCSYCRDHIDHLRDERSVWAVETAERLADGLADVVESDRVREVAKGAVRRWNEEGDTPKAMFADVAVRSLDRELSPFGRAYRHFSSEIELHPQPEVCTAVREFFGNPFRPVSLNPDHWLTPPVLGLARTMYESRDFTAMPVLADALEESGCDEAEVLAHCRAGGPHVRGCWVVDLLLGKGR